MIARAKHHNGKRAGTKSQNSREIYQQDLLGHGSLDKSPSS